MGGAVSAHGNITAAAEFNIAFDPEAAHIVFQGFPHLDLADWEAVIAHGFLHAEAEQWLQADSPRARFYERISLQTRNWSVDRRGDHWHSADALAMAYALQPEGALELLERPVAVEMAGTLTRGATVVDWNRQAGQAGQRHPADALRPGPFRGPDPGRPGGRLTGGLRRTGRAG